ncbi:hypothetical protein UFO1_2495 [Pelosinus sp. UFO1]|nr:hypothetical protein UFO1_2495 [Pelosinus sp. UFO1]
MSLYQNQGASCITCVWQEGALEGFINAIRRCKKCRNNVNRPGWDPKPNVKIQYISVISRKSGITVRKVIEP